MTGKPEATLHDYQLSMVHAMFTSAPAEAADLLERIGATRAEAEQAEKRWWFLDPTFKLRTLAEYISAWGAPDSESVHPDTDGRVRYARWNLSFWPGLQIELTEVRRANMFREFVRRRDAPQPSLRSLSDLTPWSCTLRELDDSEFGPLDHLDGVGAIGDLSAFLAIDPDSGREHVYWANFDWSLLQYVEPAPAHYVWPLGER